jgi:tetratricopeptide (TPR) repeat protein
MRSKRIILPALFFLALSFHSILYYTVFIQNKPVFNKYPAFASQIVQSTVDKERFADFSPLYLSVHIFAQKYLSDPNEAVLWFQFILVAGSAVLLFLLLRLSFAAWVAIVGAVVFTINRSILVYSSVFEPEVLLIFFLLAFLFSLSQKARLWTLVSGIFLGLILLLRLNLFPVVLIVPIYFFVRGEWKKLLLQRIILFTAPVALALLSLSIRNYSYTGSFSPVTMNPGHVFYEGNNPNANGWHVVYPPMVESIAIEIPNEVDRGHIAYRLISRRISDKRSSIPEVNSYWAGKAINFIVDHPIYWVKLNLRKLGAAFNAIRFHDIDQVSANDRSLQKSGIPSVPFGLIAAMAIIGLILSLKFWRERLLFYAVFICQIGVMTLTYASDRQRISIIALFIFFAAAMLNQLTSKKNTVKQKIIEISVALVLFGIFSLKSDRIEEDLYQRDRVRQAHKLMFEAQDDRSGGRLPQASEKNALAKAYLPYLKMLRLYGLKFNKGDLLKQSLAIAESLYAKKASFSSRFDLAIVYLENDSLAQAETIFKELILRRHSFCRTTAQSSQPYFYCAKISERRGRKQEAISFLRKALKNNPGDPWVLSHLSVLTGENRYKNLIVRYFDEIDAEYFIGQAYLYNGNMDEATRSFTYLVGKNPEYRDGLIYLCIALGAKGDFEQAARSFIQALGMNVEPLFADNEIPNIFRQWVKQNPQNTEAKYYSGLVMKAYGHYDEALEMLRQVAKENPSLDAVKAEIDWIEKAKVIYGMK